MNIMKNFAQKDKLGSIKLGQLMDNKLENTCQEVKVFETSIFGYMFE